MFVSLFPEKVTFSRKKVTFSGKKVVFTILKVTFSALKVTLLHINIRINMHSRQTKIFRNLTQKNGKRFGVLRAYSYLCRRIAGFATSNTPKNRNIMDDYPAETCKE